MIYIVDEPYWQPGTVAYSNYTGTGTAASNTLQYFSPCVDEPPKQPAPLAWLNRRVDDMVSKGKQALEAA